MEAEAAQYYLRYGDIPEGGRSRNWKIKSQKPRFHKGLSVYRTTWDAARKQWILDDNLPFLGRETISVFRHSNNPIYLLQGDEVGIGADGEPLLKNAVTVKQLRPEEVFIPHLDEKTVRQQYAKRNYERMVRQAQQGHSPSP